MVKVGQTHRRRDAGEARDGGATRDRATGHGRGRAWARWKALAPARRTVAVDGPGVAGVDGGELGCGRRSSVRSKSALQGVWGGVSVCCVILVRCGAR